MAMLKWCLFCNSMLELNKQRGEQEILGVLVIDLEHHYLLLVVAVNGAV